MRTKALYVAAAVLCAAACSKSSGNSTPGSNGAGPGYDSPTSPTYPTPNSNDPAPTIPNTVNANPSLDYNPAQLTVTAGTSVSFVFGSVAHTVSFVTNGSPASIPATSNATVSVSFPTAGSYSYYCQIHPYMQGTIVVQ